MTKTFQDYKNEANNYVHDIAMMESQIEKIQKSLATYQNELQELKDECLLITGEELE